ncbi:sugar transferase [Phormidium sp. LEGE 05292]|uniref:sugar transferase n=1 Tax=[Phormidium] sp. LEGE 05292 TaxID=767427 RepID=UPI0018806432|nr:sugar transferase [Phormidium sp. LEGE 05292]MBE9229159.1 sugar transferase [Phormidium sp. LEGE 05292]
MSLVGTRTPTVEEVEKYEIHHWKRLQVKTGITSSTVTDFEDIVRMDVDYQRKWSIAYDLYLIFQTIWVVLAKKGAC